MIKYQEFFLKDVKLFLFYFVKFIKDDQILLKEYKRDYAVEKPNF